MSSEEITFASLYLYHARAHSNGIKVINCRGTEEEPNESLMRLLEDGGGISEIGCMEFREQVSKQFENSRLDLLFSKLGTAFKYFLMYEKEQIQAWLSRYPHAYLILART